jgi:hypothetical protein
VNENVSLLGVQPMSIQVANREGSVIITLKNRNVHSATKTSQHVLAVSVIGAIKVRMRKSALYVTAKSHQIDGDVTYA